MTTLSDNNAIKIFKSRGLSMGGCKKASGLAFLKSRLMIPGMVETYIKVSTVESPLRVNNWRPRPPISLTLQNLLFIYGVRHCAFFNRSTDLPITANKINDIGIVPNDLHMKCTGIESSSQPVRYKLN